MPFELEELPLAPFEPFEAASKAKVVAVEYNGEQAKIKAMVETKSVTWDAVEVESPDVARGCDEGLFEKIDWAKVGDKADFSKSAVVRARVRPPKRKPRYGGVFYAWRLRALVGRVCAWR